MNGICIADPVGQTIGPVNGGGTDDIDLSGGGTPYALGSAVTGSSLTSVGTLTSLSVSGTAAIGSTGVQASNVASFKGGTQNQVNIVNSADSGWGLLLTQSQGGGGYHTSTNSPAVNRPCAVVNVQNDALNFGTNNTMRWTIDHDGHLYPGGDGNLDLGKPTQRCRNVYTTDLHLSNKGSTNSVDNTWGDFTIQEGESDLFLINNRNGKKYKFNLTEVS